MALLDTTGLLALWERIKSYVGGVKADVMGNFDSYVANTQKGAANGVATLDANKKLTSSQIPDSVTTGIANAQTAGTTAQGQVTDLKAEVERTYVKNTQMGVAGGVATLDTAGKVPAAQLPGYVDDVREFEGMVASGTIQNASTASAGKIVYVQSAKCFAWQVSGGGLFNNSGDMEGMGELDGSNHHVPVAGKIYVDTVSGKTYRWSGTDLAEISSSIALGTTSSTAFRGDYGDIAYQHALKKGSTAYQSGLYKVTVNNHGHVTAATAATKADITGLGIPGSDTTYSAATASALGLVKLGNATQQTVAAAAPTATAGRTYAVQMNSAQQLVVNVPWVNTDTTYTLPTANNSTLGGVKTGYPGVTTAGVGVTVPLQVDTIGTNAGKAYIELDFITADYIDSLT